MEEEGRSPSSRRRCPYGCGTKAMTFAEMEIHSVVSHTHPQNPNQYGCVFCGKGVVEIFSASPQAGR